MTNAQESPQENKQPASPELARQVREQAAKRHRTAALIALNLGIIALIACIVVAILVPGFTIPMVATAAGLLLLLVVTKGTPRRVKESIRGQRK